MKEAAISGITSVEESGIVSGSGLNESLVSR